MFRAATIIATVLVYMGLLLVVALIVERKRGIGKRLVRNPVVYTLSLAVYCTTWTFYGSVGKAATSGMLFITVYIGATLGIVLWWSTLRKLVRIKHTYHINSIADFISARYGKSQSVAALVTVMALMGTAPYMALQLKSVFTTIAILSTGSTTSPAVLQRHLEILVVVAMIAFTIGIGVRRLAPGERHEGMVAALAVECLVKLLAFLVVGGFVTYGLFDGFGDIFDRLAASSHHDLLDMGSVTSSTYILWGNYTVLSMSAILFLPRQFHVAVVENYDERHIRTAQWLLPLYLILINLFVLPVAAAGLLKGLPVESADTYVLALPMAHGKPWLALLTFLGGFSAAMGMIMISAMTLATMVSNHLILPLAGQLPQLRFLRRRVLPIRWLAVVLVLLLGYLFETRIGQSAMLVNIGMMSFAAALQFAPAILGGIFWRHGNRAGALAGLGGGFAIWCYSLLLPALIRDSWPASDFLQGGPLGLWLLRPEHLLGLSGLDPLSHAVFWSLTFNVGLYVTVSYLARQGVQERTLAGEFVDVLTTALEARDQAVAKPFIDLAAKRQELTAVLRQYLDVQRVIQALADGLNRAGIGEETRVTAAQLATFLDVGERALAGVIGAAPARAAMKHGVTFSQREAQELSRVYARVLSDLLVDPHQLRERIDYYEERQQLLSRHAVELESKIAELDREIEERKRAEHERNLIETKMLHTQKLESLGVLAGGIAHDFNNLLVAILGNTDLALAGANLGDGTRRCLTEIESASVRAADLCNQMLAYSGKGRFVIEMVNLSAITEEMVRIMEVSVSKKAELRYDIAVDLPLIEADSTQIRQVIMNLITNASEALGDQTGTITVRTGVQDCLEADFVDAVAHEDCRPGPHVFVEVTDTGCGMDQDTRQRIFDPFFTTKFTGRGLGMAAVLGIMRGHRGAITVASEPGRGSVFRVLFPVVPGAVAAAQATTRAPAVDRTATDGGTILVVDDDDNVRNVCSLMLKQAGFNVLTAGDGREGVSVYERHRADIVGVVLDLTMPVMDGREAASALLAIDPQVRILLSSGYSEQEAIREFVDWQPAGFVQKPYRSADLIQRIRVAIDPSR